MTNYCANHRTSLPTGSFTCRQSRRHYGRRARRQTSPFGVPADVDRAEYFVGDQTDSMITGAGAMERLAAYLSRDRRFPLYSHCDGGHAITPMYIDPAYRHPALAKLGKS